MRFENNLLRCDLSESQLQSLDNLGWMLSSEAWLDDNDTLLKEWNGFKFYGFTDPFNEDCSPLYVITPGGYVIDKVSYSDVGRPEPDDNDDENIYFSKSELLGFIEEAIAALIAHPSSQGQLELALGVY